RLLPLSPLVPYTTLFRSLLDERLEVGELGFRVLASGDHHHVPVCEVDVDRRQALAVEEQRVLEAEELGRVGQMRQGRLDVCRLRDRKSTRLNSSHVSSSY